MYTETRDCFIGTTTVITFFKSKLVVVATTIATTTTLFPRTHKEIFLGNAQ